MSRGYFIGREQLEGIEGEKRKMRLLNEVVFIDSQDRRWVALPGDIINGASIPRGFWFITGSPYVGLFRRASIIHDVYCENKKAPHSQVHEMFCEAMEVDGVPGWKRALMCKAVKWFGPRW